MQLLALAALLAAAYQPANALWPLPTSMTTGSSTLKLSKLFTITIDGLGVPTDLWDAVFATEAALISDNLGRLVVGRGSSDASSFSKAKTLLTLKLSLEKGAKFATITSEAQKALEDRDEAYTLTIPQDGSAATLTANSTLGLYRGLTTFGQLWYEYDGTTYTIDAPYTIHDAPAYPYRGFMLDTARNFFPVADIKRTLDAMAMVKLNTFHWHVVDSQSFPLVIPGFTELSEKGAYSTSQVYSESDVSSIISYAGARGIDVMVEIDTPGHTSVIADAHPDFIACANAAPWATYAAEPPSGQLRIANETIVNYVADMFSAVAKMFPGTLFSTGGDEVNAQCYTDDEVTQALLNKSGSTMEAALDSFTQTTHKVLEKAGKTPVVWEEMVLTQNVTLSPETKVLVWISSDDVAAVAAKGFQVIHAASNYFYLDCGHGGWVGDFPAGNSWCDPFKTWQLAYTFDPVANLTSDEAKLVIGGEHLLWTEQSGPQNLDDTVWPRAAASAELFWSGAGGNVTAALPRLHDISYRMRQRGINTISLQPEWCALRPDACDLTA